MSTPVTIARDPFARVDTVREKAEGSCAWCGQPAKFRYGSHADGIHTRPNFQKAVFCSRSCERSYNS
jgi:hypothetical protein